MIFVTMLSAEAVADASEEFLHEGCRRKGDSLIRRFFLKQRRDGLYGLRAAAPQGIRLTSTYDQMNRVTALQSTSNPTTTFSYAYGKTGNRLMASDRNGSSNYTYDSIYRMTEEAILRSEAKGTLTYGLDPVGNRQSLASTVTGINQQSASYNVNDQVLANTYDANGNTLGANGKATPTIPWTG